MRRAIAVLVFAGVLAPAAAQAAEWRSPSELAVKLGAGVVQVNRTFRFDEETGASLDGPIVAGQIVAFGSIEGLREIGPTLEPGTWVMYDLEHWRYSTEAEIAEPYLAMRRFVDEARALGLFAILAPGRSFRDRAANRDADAFHAQVQAIMDPDKYRETVCEIAAAFDGPVVAQISANNREGHTVEGLLRQYRAGLACTDRFALWGGRTPETLAVAVEFTRRVIG